MQSQWSLGSYYQSLPLLAWILPDQRNVQYLRSKDSSLQSKDSVLWLHWRLSKTIRTRLQWCLYSYLRRQWGLDLEQMCLQARLLFNQQLLYQMPWWTVLWCLPENLQNPMRNQPSLQLQLRKMRLRSRILYRPRNLLSMPTWRNL